MKDDYAYSGWLPAGTGRVEGSAKWCNDAENELKGTGLQPEYLALDLSNTPDCTCNCLARLAGDRGHPSLIISAQDMHKHKQSSDTDRAMLMSDPGGL